MATEIRIGEPYPWEPLTNRESLVPGRGRLVNFERAEPFPDSPDPEVMAEIESAARTGPRGNRRSFPPDDLPPGEPSDNLAFYRSFRYGTPWGVYIYRDGLTQVARTLTTAGAAPAAAYTAAQYLLKHHEMFHFCVDRAILSLEISFGLSNGQNPDLWFDFVARHTTYELEEACANAYAYRMARSEVRHMVKAFILSQPPGYRDVDFARKVAGTKWGSFRASESQLLSDYLLPPGQEGSTRSVGLHGLMLYNDPKNGRNVDEHFRFTGGVMMSVPMWIIP
jgi:hypothetical protein